MPRVYKIKSWLYRRNPTPINLWFKVRWNWIKARCYNKTCPSYHNYWGRWVRCLWKNIDEFKRDMYESYLKHVEEYWLKNTTIERIDNDWDYCKGNCKRVTKKEQAYNRRTNKYITIDWEKYMIEDIAEKTWLSYVWAFFRCDSYLKWKITKDELFLKQNRSWRRTWKSITINWEDFNRVKLAQLLWCSLPTAAKRIKEVQSWVKSVNDILSVKKG